MSLATPAHPIRSLNQNRRSPKALWPLLVALNSLFTLLVLLLNLGHMHKLEGLSERTQQTLIQTVDGEAFLALPADPYYRSPALIRNTVNDWLVGSLTWNYLFDGEADKGVYLDLSDRRQRIPTTVYTYQQLLSQGLRTPFLASLASAIETDGIFSGNSETYVEISYISEPERLEGNRYRVNAIAEIVVSDYGSSSSAPSREIAIPFNRTIVLRAIDPPHSWMEDLTPNQRRVHEMQRSGLQIVAIEALELDE